ncbi:hypothetical protein BSL82_16485 [Tardibacter chloracetimidivorans]|uniref:tRNA uridine(34) hydroxylase n=1 Tax=Tardibacter chloracetimidivorans TaxID=1921510 RepID=A0A1L3ZYM0_9SPHN|nr:rhodanese-related sulfurtransferase [Tardibacter chloracetimidivorans]API60689.1 hypothetical protein BSL82_16485 [Tardibacter chloracetimidivorans]
MTHALPVVVAALYRFASFDDHAALRAPLEAVCREAGTKGTLLLAPEGINGTIAGTREGVDRVLAHIRALSGCAALDVKESDAAEMPFFRMKVRLKREIVTMGVPGIDPARDTGAYVDPEDWNALIGAPDVVVIDTRNDYEVDIGTFSGAINPQTASFRDFPDWFDRLSSGFGDKPPRIAMFCTGGIRCEKATAFVKARGVEEVYHLKGGILKYLERVPPEESLWEGECFVFDQRVALGHGLAPGSHALCHGCRMPVSPADRLSPLYVEGVTCPACHEERDEESKARFAERQRQVERAALRGEQHIGREQAQTAEYGRASGGGRQ